MLPSTAAAPVSQVSYIRTTRCTPIFLPNLRGKTCILESKKYDKFAVTAKESGLDWLCWKLMAFINSSIFVNMFNPTNCSDTEPSAPPRVFLRCRFFPALPWEWPWWDMCISFRHFREGWTSAGTETAFQEHFICVPWQLCWAVWAKFGSRDSSVSFFTLGGLSHSPLWCKRRVFHISTQSLSLSPRDEHL